MVHGRLASGDLITLVVSVQTHSLQNLQQPNVSSKVFIQRDYSSGTTCKFQTKFPSELESRVWNLCSSVVYPEYLVNSICFICITFFFFFALLVQ